MTANVKVKNAKKTEYDGIQFDSALEVFTYKQLKELGIDFQYAGVVFEIIPALTLNKTIALWPNASGVDKKTLRLRTNIQKKTYTPDFTHYWLDKYFVVWESKGWANDDFVSKKKLIMQYLENGQYGFPVFLEPHNNTQVKQCIEFIKQLNKEEDEIKQPAN